MRKFNNARSFARVRQSDLTVSRRAFLRRAAIAAGLVGVPAYVPPELLERIFPRTLFAGADFDGPWYTSGRAKLIALEDGLRARQAHLNTLFITGRRWLTVAELEERFGALPKDGIFMTLARI